MSDEADEADDLTALQWAERDAMVYPNRVLPSGDPLPGVPMVADSERAARLRNHERNSSTADSGRFRTCEPLRKVVQAVQKVLAAESVPASDRAEKADARIAQLEEAMGQARELVGSYEATHKDEPGIKTLGMAVRKWQPPSPLPSDWLAAHDRRLGMRAYPAGPGREAEARNLLPAFPEEVLNGT